MPATALVMAGLGWGVVYAEEDAGAVFAMDLSEAAPGEEPDGLFVVDGEFVAAEAGGKKVLQLNAEPLAEGLVLVGDTVRGGGAIRARILASKRGRSYPRFGVGLHGISGYRLRVVPAQKSIELYKDEEVIATEPFAWEDGVWTWLELEVAVLDESKAEVRGKAWAEGGEEPGQPLIALEVEADRFNGKAVLCGTPYSGTPIVFDGVRVSGK